jgi:hypothetical protein
MRCLKWMLLLCLVHLPGLVLAGWEAVDDNYLAVVYVDPDKVRASSVFPQAWHLIDLRQRSKTGAMSRLVLMEYDCHDQRRRNLAFASAPIPVPLHRAPPGHTGAQHPQSVLQSSSP